MHFLLHTHLSFANALLHTCFCTTAGAPHAGTSRYSTLRPPSPRGAVPRGAAVPALTATARSPLQMDVFFDITGSRLPGGGGRPGPFASTGSYADALRNQGIFGNMGESWGGEDLLWDQPPVTLGATVPPPAPSPAQAPLLHPTRQNQHGGDPAVGAEDHGAVHVHPEEPQVRGPVREPAGLEGWRGLGVPGA